MTTTYVITRVSDNTEAYRYQCDGDPLAFDEYPETEFTQAALAATPAARFDGRRSLDRFEFLLMFTVTERIAIRESQDPVVLDLLEMMRAGDGINLDLDFTKDAIQYLASINLIAPSRVEEILRG
jgi:hypothetical protein